MFIWANKEMHASSRLSECHVFNKSSAAKRSKFVDKIQRFSTCTSWEHLKDQCSPGKHGANLCSIQAGLSVCAKEQHKILHVPELGVHHVDIIPKVQKQRTESDVMSVKTKSFLSLYKAQVSKAGSHEATSRLILEDPASRDEFIIHALAKELKQPTRPVAASIKMPIKSHKAYQARIRSMQ